MLKYYVRTTGERTLDDSYKQISYKLLVDTEHNARKSFVEQLEYLATLKSDVVILEDDLILCKDFKSRIEEVINKHKDMIVNFFYSPKKYMPSQVQDSFMWNQCIYYPNAILKVLAVEMRACYERMPKRAHDEVEQIALNNLGIKNYVYRPCLVQHLDNGSLIGNGSNYRRTLFFIDYLDELGISYAQAGQKRWLIELKYLLKRKFQK